MLSSDVTPSAHASGRARPDSAGEERGDLDHDALDHPDRDHLAGSSRGTVLLGLGATLAVALCTLWLAASGHLDLYINPRYDLFTVILSGIAVVASIPALGVALRRRGQSVGVPASRVWRRVRAAVATVVVVGLSLGLLLLPPSTLSARTAAQRTVQAGSLSDASGATGNVALLGSDSMNTAGFGVKDWASLIRQTTDTSALVGKRLDLTGFVVASGSGGFTLTRFVISCCAVDAQPVGLGVLPSAGAAPKAGAWVRVTGALVVNPDVTASNRLVIRVAELQSVKQPSDPYEY